MISIVHQPLEWMANNTHAQTHKEGSYRGTFSRSLRNAYTDGPFFFFTLRSLNTHFVVPLCYQFTITVAHLYIIKNLVLISMLFICIVLRLLSCEIERQKKKALAIEVNWNAFVTLFTNEIHRIPYNHFTASFKGGKAPFCCC